MHLYRNTYNINGLQVSILLSPCRYRLQVIGGRGVLYCLLNYWVYDYEILPDDNLHEEVQNP